MIGGGNKPLLALIAMWIARLADVALPVDNFQLLLFICI